MLIRFLMLKLYARSLCFTVFIGTLRDMTMLRGSCLCKCWRLEARGELELYCRAGSWVVRVAVSFALLPQPLAYPHQQPPPQSRAAGPDAAKPAIKISTVPHLPTWQ